MSFCLSVVRLNCRCCCCASTQGEVERLVANLLPSAGQSDESGQLPCRFSSRCTFEPSVALGRASTSSSSSAAGAGKKAPAGTSSAAGQGQEPEDKGASFPNYRSCFLYRWHAGIQEMTTHTGIMGALGVRSQTKENIGRRRKATRWVTRLANM